MNWLQSRLGMPVSTRYVIGNNNCVCCYCCCFLIHPFPHNYVNKRRIRCFSNALACILCVGPDQSILHPSYELPGSDVLFFSSIASNSLFPTLPSYLGSNSIPFPSSTWRALHFQENGTLTIYHDFVLKVNPPSTCRY